MHFCAEELMAIMLALPFVGVAVTWCKGKIRKLRRSR